MNRDHPALRAPEFGPDAAGELLRGGRVALFLDGLDEMPEGARDQALTCQWRRRIDFFRLLEGASERQVLRQAGAVYQFRHAALQTHLAGMYHGCPGWKVGRSGSLFSDLVEIMTSESAPGDGRADQALVSVSEPDRQLTAQPTTGS